MHDLKQRLNTANLSIKMNGVILNSYKYFGVLIDKNIEWCPHIDYIRDVDICTYVGTNKWTFIPT